MGYRNPYMLPGSKTYVDEDNTKNIPPDEQAGGSGNSGGGQSSPATKPDQRMQALPRERKPDSEIKRPAQPVVNSPPESGGHPAGSIHKDRMRTKGVPGDQYNPEPIDQTKGQFRRRSLNAEETHEASNMGKKPSGAAKQRAQKGTAKKKSHLWYLKNRKQVIRRQMIRYRKNKKKGLFKRDKRLRRQHPNWFSRKPGGGYSSARERAKDWRKGNTRTKTKHKTQKKANLENVQFVIFYDMPIFMDGEGVCDLRGVNPRTGRVVYQYKDKFRKISLHDFFLRCAFAHTEDLLEFIETLDVFYMDEPMLKRAYNARRKSWGRNKKKRGIKFFKSKQYRLKNRGRIKTKQKVRRRKLKRNPKFKRMQKIRRRMQKQNPRRFRLRYGEVLTSPEIAFVAGKQMRLGFVRNVSTMTGWVTYKLGSGRVASMPLPAFWNSVVFLEETDLEAMFDLIDAEIGLGAYELEMDADHMRMCMEMMEVDGRSEAFKEMCLSETGVASVDAMTPDQLESVASNLIHEILTGGGRQVDRLPEGDVFPRDDDDVESASGLVPLYFGQVRFPEEDSIPQPNASRVAARCADMGVYDKADLVRRETKPKEKSPSSVPDGDEDESAYEGLPTWIGPNKLKEERENRTPAQGMSVDRDRPGAPGSAKVIPRGQGFVGRTASPTKPYAGDRGERLLDQSQSLALWETKYGSKKYWVITDFDGRMVAPWETGFAKRRDAFAAWDTVKGPSEAQVRFIKGLFDKLERKGWIDSSKVLTDEQIETLDPKAVDKLIRELKAIRSENNEWEVAWYYGNGRPKWRKKAHRQIVATKMAEILDGCSPKIFDRASDLSFSRKRVDPRNAVWLFDVASGSEPNKTYRVRLKAQRKGNLRNLSKADVLVSCNCNFWRWQGPEHWAKQSGYLYGKPMGTASKPNIKDPDKQHAACKHVVSVLKYLNSRNVFFRAKKPPKRKVVKNGTGSSGIIPTGDE